MLTAKALATASEVTVLVDNAVAFENVRRLALSQGCTVEKTEGPDGLRLLLRRQASQPPQVPGPQPQAPASGPAQVDPACNCSPTLPLPLLIFVPSNCLGRGSDELGERLLAAFFHTLPDLPQRPATIVFMNSGVKLVAEGSRALEDLKLLESQGVELLACGTCLDYFGLMDKLAVGRVSNMYELADRLLGAGRLVEL
jgi:selenium metabolism protein YedF